MRGLYTDSRSRPHKGYHTHIPNTGAAFGTLPLCKLTPGTIGTQTLKEWLYEDGPASCPACKKIASQQLAGGAA